MRCVTYKYSDIDYMTLGVTDSWLAQEPPRVGALIEMTGMNVRAAALSRDKKGSGGTSYPTQHALSAKVHLPT